MRLRSFLPLLAFAISKAQCSLPAVNDIDIVANATDNLFRRYTFGPRPNRETIRRWVALGDSFSAGPGAGRAAPGDSGECRRRLGAYAPQLQASPLFQDGYNNPQFVFVSCTGDVVDNILDNQVQTVDRDTEIVTLSITGNDIGFAGILTACVFGPFGIGNCDGAIQNARNTLYGAELWDKYRRMMVDITSNLDWLNRGDNTVPPYRTAIFQTSYPPFFDSWTGQCNSVGFIPILPRPKITNALRDALNLLGQELNAALAYWIDYENEFFQQRGIGLLRFADQDELYNQHRFCRDGVEEPDRNNPDTWFFNLASNSDVSAGVSSDSEPTVSSENFASTFDVDPSSCDDTQPAGQGELADTLPCLIARAIEDGDAEPGVVWPATSESIQKSFHPRIAGFAATSDFLQNRLLHEPGLAFDNGVRDLRIMAIGDTLTIGVNGNSYRQTLHSLLTRESGPGLNVEWVGTQHQGQPPSNSIEGYFLASIPKIQSNLAQNDAISDFRPNVVILTAGYDEVHTLDPDDFGSLNRTRNELYTLIDFIFNECDNCVVLVGDIPAAPLDSAAAFWPPSAAQRTRLRFNAMISEVVNKQQVIHANGNDKRHVLKVHFTPSPQDTTGLLPNPAGYDKMAYDLEERLWDASRYGWIAEPVGGLDNGGNSSTDLRILPLGDSITWGFPSPPSGNGYRLQLRNDLSDDYSVVFAGTESNGGMTDPYMAGWPGNTIDQIQGKMRPSLQQNPNIVLLHAGTNDMNAQISSSRNLPFAQAPQRLASLIDQVIDTVPDSTVILVAQIIHALDGGQDARTTTFNNAIPGIIQQRANAGTHIRIVDMSVIGRDEIDPNSGGVHPTPGGYSHMGDVWAAAIRDLPSDWIRAPVGDDPVRPPEDDDDADANANGGPDPNIPPPNFGVSPVQTTSKTAVLGAAFDGFQVHDNTCARFPSTSDWAGTGEIAAGFGRDGAWKWSGLFQQAGKVADGLHLDPDGVRLVDMNGDGKADYVHLDADTGRLVCWINNLPGPYAPAGNNGGVIASGADWDRESIRLADLDGDGKADYLIIDQNTGAVTVYWNGGPDASAQNGWRFIPGGVIATGVPHANWVTLQFPDINGDGRADYVIEGVGGSLGMWLNTGQPGSRNAFFVAQGGIASGAESDLSRIVFADFDGDGRDDYGIFDDNAGLTGFLNIRTQKEGVPLYANQGPPKTIASGIGQPPEHIILADMDGDGKDDYVYVDRTGGSGALFVWYNRGRADTSRAMDGLYFADMDGDGVDDYIWIDHDTGAPYLFLNEGPTDSDPLGWHFNPINNFNPIASGAGPRDTVHFGDINGDGLADYCTIDTKTGELHAYLNNGPADNNFGWSFSSIGSIASGLGPGANTRLGDIDGDGFDDYIQLLSNGRTVIYRNNWDLRNNRPGNPAWLPFAPSVNAAGIGQRPEDISFYDIDGDGKVDYLWTRNTDGAVFAYRNNFPNNPQWVDSGLIFQYNGNGNDAISGASTRWATMQKTGRASYIQVNPQTDAIAAYINVCPEGSDTARPISEGLTCDPEAAPWGCSQNATVILRCFCPKGEPRCLYTSFGVCRNGANTCHVGDDCATFGACC